MLKIKNLRYKYKNFTLRSVNVDIKRSHVLGVFGANGAGKSTLIQLVAHELIKQEGTVLFNDKLDYRNVMAYAPSYFPFNQKQSIKELAKTYSLFYKDWNQETFERYCEIYELKKEDRLKKLSFGMRKRLVMAIALSHKAKLLILDEALEGIDPFIREQILADLRDYIYKYKPTVIIASHNLEQYESFIDHVIYLEDGDVIINEDIFKFREIANYLLEDKLDNVKLANFALKRQMEQNNVKN